jgi:hypothetical protein
VVYEGGNVGCRFILRIRKVVLKIIQFDGSFVLRSAALLGRTIDGVSKPVPL